MIASLRVRGEFAGMLKSSSVSYLARDEENILAHYQRACSPLGPDIGLQGLPVIHSPLAAIR